MREKSNLPDLIMSSKMAVEINRVLPKHLTVERLQRICLNEFRKTPKLLECNRDSVLGSLMKCAELGLEPSSALGHAYLIPYNGECNLIIGYKGLLQLVRQSGKISNIYARCVYENDDFTVRYGIKEELSHVPARVQNKEPGLFYCVYAICHFKDGSFQFEVMFNDEIQKIKKNTQIWRDHFDEMARKTVLRRLSKYLPMGNQAQEAISIDEAADRGEQKWIIDMEPEVIKEESTVNSLADKLENQ